MTMRRTAQRVRKAAMAAGIVMLLAGVAAAGGNLAISGWVVSGDQVVVEVVNSGSAPATGTVTVHVSTVRGPLVLTAPIALAPGDRSRIVFPVPGGSAEPTILGAVVDDGSPF